MDLRMKFNEDEENYDKWRPTYVRELFDQIIQYSNIDEISKALEIGIGTGQATLPILKTGAQVTAIEIGAKLAEYSKQKFASYCNFEVVNVDFEDFFSHDQTFNLIYSATAFHWIPEEVGYTKSFELLKPGGVLALFWNHPFVNREDDILHNKIQEVYRKYKLFEDKHPIEFNEKDCAIILNRLKKYGFSNCQSHLFYSVRQFTADEYIGLLNTYSDHRALPKQIKKELETEISILINDCGGILTVYDTIDLYLAQKP